MTQSVGECGKVKWTCQRFLCASDTNKEKNIENIFKKIGKE